MAGAVVCFDAEVARILAGLELAVLLCGTDAEALGAAAHSIRGAARVGVLIGDPASGPDRAAAVAMATELFGADPVVVTSVDQARRISDRARDIAPSMG